MRFPSDPLPSLYISAFTFIPSLSLILVFLLSASLIYFLAAPLLLSGSQRETTRCLLNHSTKASGGGFICFKPNTECRRRGVNGKEEGDTAGQSHLRPRPVVSQRPERRSQAKKSGVWISDLYLNLACSWLWYQKESRTSSKEPKVKGEIDLGPHMHKRPSKEPLICFDLYNNWLSWLIKRFHSDIHASCS